MTSKIFSSGKETLKCLYWVGFDLSDMMMVMLARVTVWDGRDYLIFLIRWGCADLGGRRFGGSWRHSAAACLFGER